MQPYANSNHKYCDCGRYHSYKPQRPKQHLRGAGGRRIMPIKPENKVRYPKNWKQISEDIRFNRAKNKCEKCGCENHKPHPITGSKVILTVAHLDHMPENCDYANLMAMCQKCHNAYDREHRNETRKATKEKATGQTKIF